MTSFTQPDEEAPDLIQEAVRSDLGRKFVRCLSRHGKTGQARTVFTDALVIVSRRLPSQEPKSIVENAVTRRMLNLFEREVGTLELPLRPELLRMALVRHMGRSEGPAIRSIIEGARRRRERTPETRLAAEIFGCLGGPTTPTDPAGAVEALRIRRA